MNSCAQPETSAPLPGGGQIHTSLFAAGAPPPYPLPALSSINFGPPQGASGGLWQRLDGELPRGTTASAALTIGSGVTIRGQTGSLGYHPNFDGSGSAVVFNKGTIEWTSGTAINAPTTLANQGTISIDPLGVLNLRGGTMTTQTGAQVHAGTLSAVTVNGDSKVVGGRNVSVTNG